MQISFFRSTWGMQQASLEEKLRAIQAAGFEGVELGVPETAEECRKVRDLLDELGLEVIVQQWTGGHHGREHAGSFEQQYCRAVLLKPWCVNSHTGKDFFPVEENLFVFDRAAKLEREHGVPVVHETHRGRALFSTGSTMALLDARPGLRLAADFSHWCCVHESMLDDQMEAVRQACARAYHVHARVGYPQGPQIPDPRAPEWQDALETHLKWWQEIRRLRHQEGCKFLPVCPEFGPPPYMVLLPHTREPIADLWEVNCWMRDWLRERLAATEVTLPKPP